MSDTEEQQSALIPSLTTPELFEALAQQMVYADAATAEIDRIMADIAAELAIPKMDLADAKQAMDALRAEINRRMTEDGSLRMEHHGLQVLRPKKSEWRITDVDKALAHLADIDPNVIPEVQRVVVVTDEKRLIEIAKLRSGDKSVENLEGVEQIASFGFSVKRMG